MSLQEQLNKIDTEKENLVTSRDTIINNIISENPDILGNIKNKLHFQIESQFSNVKIFLRSVINQLLNDSNLSFSSNESPMLDNLVSNIMMEYLQFKLLNSTNPTGPTGPTGPN